MKIFFFIAAFFFANVTFAQTQGVKLVQYVFNAFTPGAVKMKSGETSQQLLNYNMQYGLTKQQ